MSADASWVSSQPELRWMTASRDDNSNATTHAIGPKTTLECAVFQPVRLLERVYVYIFRPVLVDTERMVCGPTLLCGVAEARGVSLSNSRHMTVYFRNCVHTVPVHRGL